MGMDGLRGLAHMRAARVVARLGRGLEATHTSVALCPFLPLRPQPAFPQPWWRALITGPATSEGRTASFHPLFHTATGPSSL